MSNFLGFDKDWFSFPKGCQKSVILKRPEKAAGRRCDKFLTTLTEPRGALTSCCLYLPESTAICCIEMRQSLYFLPVVTLHYRNDFNQFDPSPRVSPQASESHVFCQFGANVKDNRPVNLDFTTFKLPLPAITSILHRVSGGVLFVGVAVLLFLLDMSLESAEGFARVAEWLGNPLVKLITWAVVAALLYHLLAGIKHLIMDLGIGESLAGGILGARIVVTLALVSIILAGVWIW